MKKIIDYLVCGLVAGLVFAAVFLSCERQQQKLVTRDFDTVNIGTTANDGTGDPIRTGFRKLNIFINHANTIGWDNLSAADINFLLHLGDSLNIHLDVNDTTSMLGNYARNGEVMQMIADSLAARLNDGVEVVPLTSYESTVGNYFFRELQAWGLDAVGFPVGAAQPMTTNKTLADNTGYWQSFELFVADTITGVRFIQRTQGGYTAADSNCFALYTVSGATYTRIRTSANNGDLWKGAGYSIQTVPFASTYIAPAGQYMVFFSYNQSAETTAPNIYCWNGSVGVSQLLTGANAHRISGTVATEGGPPTTEVAGDLTASDVIFGLWLY
jgi:hypothetical protein